MDEVVSEGAGWAPPSHLRPYVARAVGYRFSGLSPGTHLGMPSGLLTVVVSLDQDLTVTPVDEATRALGVCLGGPHTRAVEIHHDGSQHGVQLDLTPAGARALLGVTAAEVSGACVELADLIGSRATMVRDALHEIPSWTERFELVQAELFGDEAAPTVDDRLTRTWARIMHSGGAVAVRELADDAGWSTRQLTDRFSREFGMGPKTACRLTRFGRAHRLVQGGTPGAEVAARCGYADQSHLVRDWRAFTGTTPTGWLASDDLALQTGDALSV